jgi:hypothetical protein
MSDDTLSFMGQLKPDAEEFRPRSFTPLSAMGGGGGDDWPLLRRQSSDTVVTTRVNYNGGGSTGFGPEWAVDK